MAFKVVYKGIEVVCDTPQDIEALAERLQPVKSVTITPPEPKRQHSNGHVAPSIASFVKTLGDKQKQLLRFLSETGSKKTDTELREALGLEKNMQLAGVISTMSKMATKRSLEFGNLFQSEMTSKVPGQRAYVYWIPTEAIEEVRKGLGN